jgi:propanol-preferring alcohol dehydrogenase
MSYDIPKTQKAAVKVGSGETATVEIKEIPVPELLPGQMLVKINYTGLCASDKSLLQDEWGAAGMLMQPAANGIAGHEGAGVVVKLHDSVKNLWNIGDRAGIKYIASVCYECESCMTDRDEIRCRSNLSSGLSTPGTFAEYVATNARYATRIPEGVKDEEAGPIMCGGVTAYTALKKSEVRPGQWIVIPGAGGGLGHFAVQYAKAMGMRIIGIDGGDEKKELSLRLGAEHYIDFTKVCPVDS